MDLQGVSVLAAILAFHGDLSMEGGLSVLMVDGVVARGDGVVAMGDLILPVCLRARGVE